MMSLSQARAQVQKTVPADAAAAGYVRFHQGRVEVVDAASAPLEGGDAVPFREMVVADLVAAQPRRSSASAKERLEWKAQASRDGALLYQRLHADNDGRVSVAAFGAACDEVRALNSLQGIAEATQALTGRITEQKAQAARAARDSRMTHIRQNTAVTANILSGLLVESGLVPPRNPQPPGAPFGAAELRAALEQAPLDVTQNYDERYARVFVAIRADASLAPIVLDQLDRYLEDMAGGDIAESTSGVWLPVTALVLSLHPDALRQVFLTTEQVDRLARHAYLALGGMLNMITPGGMHPEYAKASRTRDMKVILMAQSRLARKFMAIPQGGEIATRLLGGLAILAHNAQRMERFAQSQQAMDPDMEDMPLFDLLEEHVPAASVPMPRIDAAASARPGVLTWVEQPVQAVVEEAMPPETAQPAQAPTRPAPDQAVHVHVNRDAAPAAGTAREEKHPPVADEKAVRSARQPGAKLKNPAEHFHREGEKALSRERRANTLPSTANISACVERS